MGAEPGEDGSHRNCSIESVSGYFVNHGIGRRQGRRRSWKRRTTATIIIRKQQRRQQKDGGGDLGKTMQDKMNTVLPINSNLMLHSSFTLPSSKLSRSLVQVVM